MTSGFSIRRPRHISAEDIKLTRVCSKRTPEEFARALGVSSALYERLESGRIRPRGPILRLLEIIEDKGFEFLKDAIR